MSEPTTQSAAVELKACPFCGGEAYMTEGHRDHWRVECRQCGAKRHLHYVFDGQARAITAWNTRAPIAPATGAVEAAVAAERERCAKVAEDWRSPLRPGTDARLSGHQDAARLIAAAIRGTDAKGEGAA